MAFYTYLLRCADGSYYAGHTDDLDFRLASASRALWAAIRRNADRSNWCGPTPSLAATRPSLPSES